MIVRRLRGRRRTIERAIWEGIRGRVPSIGESETAEYEDGQREAISSIVSYSLDALAGGPDWSGPIPEAAVAQARRAARLRVSLGTVQRRYFTGHRELGEFVTRELERAGFSNDGEVIHHLRRTQEALLEHVAASIEREYEDEYELIAGTRRSEIARRLLAGERVEQTELAQLDYDIHAPWHVGVVVSGVGGEGIVQHLKDRYRHRILAVRDSGSMGIWLSADAVEASDVSPNGDGQVSVAIGEPGEGLDGWRLTYSQARAAFAVAVRQPGKAVRYADNRLLATVLENDTLARSLTQKYLIPLRSHHDGGRKLRRTVRIYMELECNATSAAHQLRVGRHTVENRIQVVEQLIGCTLRRCFSELDIALRLEDLDGRQ